jgi:hypothetical protein
MRTVEIVILSLYWYGILEMVRTYFVKKACEIFLEISQNALTGRITFLIQLKTIEKTNERLNNDQT